MDISARVKIPGTSRVLGAYYHALEPEQNFKTERGSYSLRLNKSFLEVEVQAQDVVALRAVLSTIMGILSIVHATAEACESAQKDR